MASLLRILVIKDVSVDIQPVLRELQLAGYYLDHEIVETRAAMEKELWHKVWDIVFYDGNLSNFSVVEALATITENGHNLPFLLCTSESTAETFVTCFQREGDDFLVKESHAELLPVLERVLRSKHKTLPGNH